MNRDQIITLAESIHDPKPLQPIHKLSWTVYPEWLQAFAKAVIREHELLTARHEIYGRDD